MQWIALSVIKPLADEMRTINSTLARKGITEQIGSECVLCKLLFISRMHDLPLFSMEMLLYRLQWNPSIVATTG